MPGPKNSILLSVLQRRIAELIFNTLFVYLGYLHSLSQYVKSNCQQTISKT